MKVILSREKPPIYEACVKAFGVNWNKGIIFTYGNTIHCKQSVIPQKIAHEKTHVKQQLEYEVEKWWARYLEDSEFRLSQEVEAYQNEIAFIKANERNFKLRDQKIEKIYYDLSSSMYGNIVSYTQAKLLINFYPSEK